nr:type I restriction enzyme endonuclease domain-containing protein [Chamaesiphon sp. VAR_48_metabat_403]
MKLVRYRLQIRQTIGYAYSNGYDWNLKESIRARMKVIVKRLLRQYGYPPQMEALAIEVIVEQSKVFAELDGKL